MAKITTLRDRETREVLYPQTQARFVHMSNGENLEEVIDTGKFALFVDMWNSAWGKYGKYDPVNAPDPEHPFMGNEVWCDYNEALSIYRASAGFPMLTNNMYSLRSVNADKLRTALPFLTEPTVSLYQFGLYGNNIDVVRFYPFTDNSIYVSNMVQSFRRTKRVLTILNVRSLKTADFYSFGSSLLEYLLLKELRSDLPLNNCKNLERVCFEYIIKNASNTTAITITVHPDVYAKLTDENNTEWHQILLDGAVKNITFATI